MYAETSSMKALVHDGHGGIALVDRPLPEIQEEGDAIVRVTLSTICTSDLHIIHGAVPRALPDTVLGHEFVGEVVETGPGVHRFKAGDRVAVNVETFCGTCFFCRRGWVNNCEHGGWELGCRIDGCQAEYVRVPYADNAFTLIPPSVSDEAALFLGDVLASGYWGCEIAEINPGDTVAVIGCGPVGATSMMCARLFGAARVIGIDIDASRREFALREKLADVVLDPRRDDVRAWIGGVTSGRGADAVIEAAGTPETFDMAWRIARPNAVVSVVAMYGQDQVLPLPSMYGKNLVFKTGGVDAHDLDRVMGLIAAGRIDTNCLISRRFSLDDVLEAYRAFEAREGGCMKVALTPPRR